MSWQWAIPIVLAAGFAAATPAILRALPAPTDEPLSDPYSALATRRFAVVTFLLTAALGLLVLALAPTQAAAWVGLGTVGVLAAMIDARTAAYGAFVLRLALGLAALAHGLPPTSGIALGFDRLAMLASGAPRIEDVLWLPPG